MSLSNYSVARKMYAAPTLPQGGEDRIVEVPMPMASAIS